VESYINNLPYVTNGPIYDSISKIFGMMVPQFNQLLEVLHTSDRLVSPSTVPVKLSQCQVGVCVWEERVCVRVCVGGEGVCVYVCVCMCVCV
jgi:Protein of unknown function (DUF4246)